MPAIPPVKARSPQADIYYDASPTGADGENVMASVAVPAAWIAQGTLPPCCARHGGPTTRQGKRRFDTKTPLWVLPLILVGVLVAVVVAMAVRKSVQGQIPECDECAREQRQFKLTVLGAWVADVVVLVLAAQLGGAGLVLWLLVTLGALVWSFAGGQRYRVHGNLTKDQMWVELNGASDEFTAAINAVVRPEPPAPLIPPQPLAPSPIVNAQPAAEPVLAAEPVPAAEPEPQPQPVASPEPVAAAPLHSGLPTRPTVLPRL